MDGRKRRRPSVQLHRARPTDTHRQEKGTGDHMEEEIAREIKEKYVEFINRLLLRMDLQSLQRMLDAAINEV